MVAGSPARNAHEPGIGGTFPNPVSVAHVGWRPLALPRNAGLLPALLGWYLLAAAALLLPWPFGTHPVWAYNWEGYTAWRWATYWEPPVGPTMEIWAPTDGLMTDSGQGPLVGLPVAVGIALAGVSVEAMRVPVALLAATAVPLLWLLGRRVVSPGPAFLAAALLATSPVFLLYGRTATLVGVSLLPLLLSALALAHVLDAGAGEGWRWRREGLLAGSHLLGIYAYAPVRLLWPLTIGLLVLAAIRDSTRRGTLLRAALLCIAIVPAATMALERLIAPDPDPVAAATSYFNARGEQLVAMSANPTDAGHYLRAEDAADIAGWDAAARLVEQNATDLIGLLLDRDTLPVPTDYWNERGRFWPWFFLPFGVIGAATAVWRWFREGRMVMALPLALFLGLALPLLLTSRVHVGRLLPALPFALLLVAAGVWAASGWLTGMARRVGMTEAARWIAPLLAGVILLPAAASARVDLETPVAPSRESLTAATLADWSEEARERGGAVLVEDPALGDDIERVHAATYRLDLGEIYRSVDLQQEAGAACGGIRLSVGEASRLDVANVRPAKPRSFVPQDDTTVASRCRGDESDSRPTLHWRGALGALEAGEIARPCERLWFVAPEIAEEFLAAWRAARCRGAPDSVILP